MSLPEFLPTLVRFNHQLPTVTSTLSLLSTTLLKAHSRISIFFHPLHNYLPRSSLLIMGSTTVIARSYPKRKRAEVTYREISSDEGEVDNESDSSDEQVTASARKVCQSFLAVSASSSDLTVYSRSSRPGVPMSQKHPSHFPNARSSHSTYYQPSSRIRSTPLLLPMRTAST